MEEARKLKMQIFFYKDQDILAILLKLLREFNSLIEHSNLWKVAGEAKVYNTFQSCLRQDALNTWVDIMVNEDEFDFQDYIAALVERPIDYKT